jgi:ribosomal protein S18 acetylase RimI-like enzyme
MGEVSIRRYRSEDRPAVREVAYRTGYMGEPVDWLWRDRPSFQDLFTTYYTDREPESLFVAVADERVVGFLTGCLDTTRAVPPEGAALGTVLRRGLLLRPGTAAFFWRAAWDVVRGGFPGGGLLDPRWPAHLHINLLPEARGLGAGGALMRAWLAHLRAAGVPGCHLGTFAENTNAIAFFERMGFRRFGRPEAVPGFRLRTGGRMHQQLMVRSLRDDG